MDSLREQRITQARIILNHPQFLSKTQKEKEQIVKDLMTKGLSIEDLRLLATERKLQSLDTGISFNILDKGVLTQILLGLSPKDVLSTCKINRQYRHVCSDSKVFEQLLSAHYPEAATTDNPRQQYIALTDGVETYYRLRDSQLPGGKFLEQIGPSRRPEMVTDWSFSNTLPLNIVGFFKSDVVVAWLQDHPEMAELVEKSFREFKPSHARFSEMTNEERKIAIESQIPVPKLNEIFQQFMLDYRTKGPEVLVKESLSKLYREDLPVGEAVFGQILEKFERFDHLVQWILKVGLPPEYKKMGGDKGMILTFKGNALPKGTTSWMAIWRAGARLSAIVQFTRRRMADRFVRKNYVRLLRNIRYRGFLTYIHRKYPMDDVLKPVLDELDALSDEELIKSRLFNEYLEEENYLIRPFTKEAMIEYIITHDNLVINDGQEEHLFSFKELTVV